MIRPTHCREGRFVPFSRQIPLFLCQPVGYCPRSCKKPYRSSLMNPPEIKQLTTIMVDRLELDVLGFTSSQTIHFLGFTSSQTIHFLSSSYSPLGLVCLIFFRDSSKTKPESFPKTKSRVFSHLRS